jgi:hypothetical protein
MSSRLYAPIAAAIVLIGTFGTWQTNSAGIISKSFAGLQTDDGKLVAGGAVIMGVAALLANRPWMRIVCTVFGIIILGVTIYDTVEILSAGDDSSGIFTVSHSIGWGIVVSLLGSAAYCITAPMLGKPAPTPAAAVA